MQSRYMLKLRAKQILVSVKPSPLFAGMMLTAISFLIYIFQYSGSGNTYAELINSGVRDITKLSEALVSDLTGNTGALVLRLVFSLLNTYISFGLVCYSFRLSSGETAVPLQEMFPPVLSFLKVFRPGTGLPGPWFSRAWSPWPRMKPQRCCRVWMLWPGGLRPRRRKCCTGW